MKKVISLTLVVALCLTMGTFVSAKETPSSIRLQEVISILENADGQIPDSITYDDMQLLLTQGGSQVEPILENIWAHSVPIEMPTANSPSASAPASNAPRGSYLHDAETGTTVYVDGSQFDHPVPDGQTSDGKVLTGPSIQSRAYPDDWTEANPQSYANTRSTCALTVKYPGDSSTHYGSGFLIAGDTVATAAHVITKNGVYPSYVLVTPSHRDSNPVAPYGTAMGKSYEAGSGWINSEDSNDDWGVIKMSGSFSMGRMKLMKPGDDSAGWWVRTQGYPSDIMRLTGGNIISASGRDLHASNTVYSGMSGGPMLEGRDYVIGIISLMYNGDNSSKIVKFDDWLYNKLTSY